jgi:hypothetical protein
MALCESEHALRELDIPATASAPALRLELVKKCWSGCKGAHLSILQCLPGGDEETACVLDSGLTVEHQVLLWDSRRSQERYLFQWSETYGLAWKAPGAAWFHTKMPKETWAMWGALCGFAGPDVTDLPAPLEPERVGREVILS